MDKPCCVGVTRNSEGLVGKEIKGKNVKLYHSSPKARNWTRMGVVVIHDIFGFELPNGKYIADHLATQGYEAVLPDFYEAHDVAPWPATESEISKPLEGDEFGKFFGSITSEEYWEKFDKQFAAAVGFLRKKGCSKFGVIGFCWGGIAAERVAKRDNITAVVSAHGCMHNAASYKECKANILYVSVPDDPYFSKEGQDEIKAAGGKVKIFDGMSHGFAVRGDFTNAAVKAASDEVMVDTDSLFRNSCLRKPKFGKVDKIQPAATNINAVLKVVGAPSEVEGGKFFEVVAGDDTGRLVLSLEADQKEGLSDGQVVMIRNGHVKMVKGYIRVKVDKWGKLDKNPSETVDSVGEKNISETEYERA